MKKLLKNITIITAFSSLLTAATYEYPSLYKDARIMGMGGANIALGGEAASLFYNPAGLSGMDPEEGLEFELLNLNGAFSANTFGLIGDLGSAADEIAMIQAFEAYYGQNNHVTVNDYTSLSYRGENIAWSVGVIAGAQLNFQTHTLSAASGILELNGLVAGGLVSGLSYDWNSDLHIGLGLKVIQGYSLAADLTYGEVTNLSSAADPLTYLTDTFGSTISATTFDAGVIYDLDDILPLGDTLRPSVGLSLTNIGGTDLGGYGYIPTSVNVGFAIRPDIPFLSDWAIAVDYTDLFNALYADNNGDGIPDYDKSFGKRLKIGARASLLHNSIIQLTGSTGLYNAAFTAALEMRLLIFTLVASTYAEEIGAYAGQNLDRRYQISFNMGF